MGYTYLWLLLAVGLAVVEASTTAIVCLWFILGSAAAFLASFLIDSLFIQGLVFALVSALAIFITKPLTEKMAQKKPIATNFDMIIGKTAPLTETVTPTKKGRIVFGGVSYLTAADVTIEKGTLVRVVSVSGNTLKVVNN